MCVFAALSSPPRLPWLRSNQRSWSSSSSLRRSPAPCLDDRRNARRPGRPHGSAARAKARRRRHLGVATRRRKVVAAGRSRDWRAAGRRAVSDVESGALRAAQGRAHALLQGRPQSSRMVGHGAHVDRRGPNVERRATAARRNPGPIKNKPVRLADGRSSRRAAPRPPTRRASGACTSSVPATPARPGACRARRPRPRAARSTPSSQAS